METDEYDEFTLTTAKYPKEKAGIYLSLGLNGEAGEVAEKIKKVIRDKGGVLSDEDCIEVAKELGDVLWYVSRFADELGFSLDDIMAMNMTKLQSRKERNVLSGSGDNR